MPPKFRTLPARAIACLKCCYKLCERGDAITTSSMRVYLQLLEPDSHLSDTTITQLFKWLGECGYVRYIPYHGVELTKAGHAMAVALVRRIWRPLDLSQACSFTWKKSLHMEVS
jgi:Mn-dependent DtxR family transcriptional regulator